MRQRFLTFISAGLMMAGLFFAACPATLAQSEDIKANYAHLYRNASVETDLSKMAMKNSSNADVKKFAHQVMSDNRNIAGEIMAYAVKFGFRLIEQSPASTAAAEKQMKTLNGDAFDKMYLVQMQAFVKDDQKVAADVSASGDSEVSAVGAKIESLANDRAKQITALTTEENFQIK